MEKFNSIFISLETVSSSVFLNWLIFSFDLLSLGPMENNRLQLVLLHGALGCREQMLPIAQEFESHFKVHVYEFMGHGARSNQSGDFSIGAMAQELEAFFNENQSTQVQVFGYSMGGYVALYHQVMFGPRIQNIFCLGTKFDWNPGSAEKEASMLQPGLLIEKIPAFAQLLEHRHGKHWHSVVERTAEMMKHLGQNPLLNEHSLPRISAKCTLALGDRDQMVSQQETLWAAGLVPNAEVKFLEATPHPIEKVNMQALLEMVLLCMGVQ